MQPQRPDSQRTENARPFHLSGPLRAITESATAHPWTTLTATAVSAVAAVLVTVLFIEFRTQRSDLIDPTAEFHQRWTSYTEAFGDSSDLVVVFESSSPDSIKLAMEDLAARMFAEPKRFSQILYKVEAGGLRKKGLQYLSPAQLEEGLHRLERFRPIINGGWNRLRLDSFATSLLFQVNDLTNKLKPAESTDPEPNATLPPDERAAARTNLLGTVQQTEFLARSLNRFLSRGDFTSPWPELLTVDPGMRREIDNVVYLMNESGSIGFLKARPVHLKQDFNGATPSIDRLRELIAMVNPQHPAVQIGLTGIPVLESDEMRRSQSDMIKASIISFVAVGVLLLVGFRGWKHPVLAMVMLGVGMCWTFGFTTLTIGHLNILSVSFAAILIGLGIDFAIHYLARYLELRHHGADLQQALSASSSGVGVGILTASVTTSLAFFCASFTEFLGVAELGLIAGSGVLICTAATFVVLPALVSVADRGLIEQQLPTPFQGERFRSTIQQWPKGVALISLVIIAGISSRGITIENGLPRSAVGYDYNLLNLQADGLESVEIQKRIFHENRESAQAGKNSLLYAVSVAGSAEEARQRKAEFLKLPSVDHVEELASKLPEYPSTQTQLLVQGFHAQLARLPRDTPAPSVINPNVVGRMFEELFTRTQEMPFPEGQSAATAIDVLLDTLDQLELEDQLELLAGYQQRLTGSLLMQMQRLQESADPEPVTVKDLPAALASRFVSPDGRWLLQVYPKNPIWDIEPLREFVTEVRTVDSEVTGTPLQNFEASQQIMQSYQHAAIYALVIVTFVLLMDFLGPRLSVQTVLPSTIITAVIAVAQVSTHGAIDWWIVIGAFMSLMLSMSLVLDWHSVVSTLMALLPPLLGGLLMFGTLTMLEVQFNPANLIVLPLILGIGVDDGVHVLHDFRTQHGGYRLSASTMNAIVLTSLTSMIGFGSMMIAAHRGLESLGLVLVVGVGSCLFVSLVPVPALLTIVRRIQGGRTG